MRALALLVAATLAAASTGGRVAAGHGLSIAVPSGWQLTHRRFTPCSDPVERFSLVRGDQVLMVQERLDPIRAELKPRPLRFAVRDTAAPIGCCSIGNRRGWVLQFGEGGRAFYAYLYPGRESPRVLLLALDSLRVE